MKKITIKTAAIILLLFLIMGCDKYHRDRYTGNWDFVTKRNIYTFDGSEYVFDRSDTIYYSGKITSGNLENQIIINYTENDEITASIDDDGTTVWTNYYPCARCPSGSFEKKDKVSLNLVIYNKIYGRINDKITGRKKTNN